VRNLKGNNLKVCFLVILVAGAFAPTLVHAKDYAIGVKAGDWVKYGQITVSWTGNGTEPSYVTETKKVNWVRIDFLSVAGTTASLNQTLHFNNGTQTSQSLDIDVQSSNSAGNSYLVASNLTAGDPLTPQTPGTTINQTVTRMYAGANRNVNVVDYKANETIAQVNLLFEYKTYWDQSTGVMVELYINGTDITTSDGQVTTSGGYEEISFKATETNLWSASALDIIQNNLVYIITGIAVIIVIAAAIIVFRRRKPPTSQQPLPPPPSSPPPPPS
jgi:hypothetical protein